MGALSRIFAALAGAAGEPDRLIIDNTHLKAHLTAAGLLKKGALGRCIGRYPGAG
jgi:putative transposase